MKTAATKSDKQKQKTSVDGPRSQLQPVFPSITLQSKLPTQTPLTQLLNPRPQLPSQRPSLILEPHPPVQRMDMEEDDLLQGKFIPLQKMDRDEEELLQGKFVPLQRQENRTGLPDNLKSGIESLSGLDMSDVRVHYNSTKPAQLNALAYAQGPDIHIGPGQGEPIQCFPVPLEGEAFETLYPFHALGKDKDEPSELDPQAVTKIKEGVYLLTEIQGTVNCNCFGWALGLDYDTGDKGRLYNWKKEHGGAENFTEPYAGDANIILWGDKEGAGEDNWDVLHASVKLSHAELLDRSGEFKGLQITPEALQESDIPNPFWSSAGGMGFGIFVHPIDWFEGGSFGVVLKGMKKAK